MDSNETAPNATWSDLLAGRLAPRFMMVVLGVWISAVDSLVTSTIMPTVGADLGGHSMFGWAVAGFMVGAVVASASAGRLSEMFGLRLATVVSALVFAAGCLMSGLARDMLPFLVGRLVQGVGGGWIAGFAWVTVGTLFPQRHLVRVFASISVVWGIATVVGPLVGGAFVEAGSWRGVFWFFAIQAVAFGALAHYLLRSERPAQAGTTIPWRQLLVLGAAIGSAALANVTGSSWSAALLTLAAVILFLAFLFLEKREPVSLLPKSALNRVSTAGSGYLALFALTASLTGLLAYGPSVIQKLHGLSPLWAGYAVAVQALVWTICSFTIAGTRPGAEKRWIRVGVTLICIGLALLAVWTSTAPLAQFVLAAAIMGAGFGLSSSLLNRRILASLSVAEKPTGSSALIASRHTGGAFGAAVAGTAANFAGFGTELTVQHAQATGTWVFVAALPFALVGAWSAWRID